MVFSACGYCENLARRPEPGAADRQRPARDGTARGAGRAPRRRAPPARRGRLDLIPIAPRTEMDLSAAWKFSRVIKRLQPDVIHAHDPHGVAMASAGRCPMGSAAASRSTGSRQGASMPALVAARRVDFHLKGNSFSRWKYRQVDCFIAASDGDPPDAGRRRRPGRPDGDGARRDRRRARRRGAGG